MFLSASSSPIHWTGPLVAALLVIGSPARAQDVQRPFDANGEIGTLTAELEARLDLFPGYEGFLEARLFEIGDDSYELEILYRPDEQILRARRSLTAGDVRTLRERVAEALAARREAPAPDQEGRTELLVNATLLSLGFYGYALPVAAGIDGERANVATYMLTSGAGFFGPYLATRSRSVSEAQAKLFQYGGTRGIAHGSLLGMLAAGEELSTRGWMGAGMLTSLAEAGAGYALAGDRRLTQGTAETIGVAGDFGLGIGLGTAFLIEPEDVRPRGVAGPSLLGAATGLYAGHRLARAADYRPGDARVLRMMGAVGGLAGLTGADLTGTDAVRPLVGSTIVGSVVGLGLGHRILRGVDFDAARGTYVTLGTLGGFLTGAGVAHLLGDRQIEDRGPTPYLVLGTAGAAGGLALMYRTFLDEARGSSSAGLEEVELGRTGWRLSLDPSGIATRYLPGGPDPATRRPALRLSRSF